MHHEGQECGGEGGAQGELGGAQGEQGGGLVEGESEKEGYEWLVRFNLNVLHPKSTSG